MKRVMCVWLPQWPLQRICFVQPELNQRPIVLYGPAARGGWQTVYCSRSAVSRGVRPGMPLAEAKSLLERPGRARGSAPHFAPHDPQADRNFLEELAGWCRRYSPLAGIEEADEPSALLLDLSGCAHLFGGEGPMAAQVAHDFEHAGYAVRVAVADTIGAAWAAVRFQGLVCFSSGEGGASPCAATGVGLVTKNGPVPFEQRFEQGQVHFPAASSISDRSPRRRKTDQTPIVVPPGGQSALLGPLPVEALRLSRETVATLHELGLRQVGQLQALPRAVLPARFEPEVLRRLDQALGARAEPIVAVRSREPLEAEWSFEEPTSDRRTLEAVLRRLIARVAEMLASRQEGAQRLVCRLLCAAGEPVRLEVGSVHPTASAEHLVELARLQLEQITLGGEVLGVHVEATACGPLESRQRTIFDAARDDDSERSLALLLDRLGSRLGEQSVLRPRLCPDPQPEYASRLEEVAIERSDDALRRPTAVASSLSSQRTRRVAGSERSEGPAGDQARTPLKVTLCGDAPDYQWTTSVAARPLCLKSRPVPIEVVSVVPDGPPIRFCWRQEEHLVARSWGPERIDAGWWRGRHVRRDYYRVETATGQRFWLFRELGAGAWFLHGVFE